MLFMLRFFNFSKSMFFFSPYVFIFAFFRLFRRFLYQHDLSHHVSHEENLNENVLKQICVILYYW
jgi:hypothetical protein